MAQLISVRLSRPDGSPWGFRLQGGKDFGTPLVIQKVNGGSIAEKAGLAAGDSVVKVNSTDVFNLRHKDAQDVIVKAGQTFEMTVQRGGSTWKPAVIPTGNVPKPQSNFNNVSPVTKTSLAAKKQEFTPIGSAHNAAAKGFTGNAHLNGNSDSPKLVNKQYNSPIGLYSEESIAETLSAQAEVLPTGALGVNFKKNEKNYNAAQSEVLKMIQEAEKEPRDHHDGGASTDCYSVSHIVGRAATPQPAPVPVQTPAVSKPVETADNPMCSECERVIVGVFVRIKDKNLHVECFKCATCGTSLKNVGYYNINHKLYCDIHAKLAARSNPPAPNMVPVTIPPGGKAPAGTISAALATHSLPSPSPKSPSGNFPPPFQTGANLSGPKPFSSVGASSPVVSPVSAPIQSVSSNTLPRAAPAPSTMPECAEWPPSEPENIPESTPPYIPPKIPASNENPDACVDNENPQFIDSTSDNPGHGHSNPGHGVSNPGNDSANPGHAASNPSHSNPGHGPSNPGHDLSNPGHMSSNPGHGSSNPGHGSSNPGHGASNPGHGASNPDHGASNPGHSTSNPGHGVFKLGGGLSNPGHGPSNPGHGASNPGHNPCVVTSQETHTSSSQSHEYASDSKSIEIAEAFASAQAHKMSICSAEVMNITGRRSAMECVETISDSLDTQMLISSIQERPKSPTPLPKIESQDAPNVLEIPIQISDNPGHGTKECPAECPMTNPENPVTCTENPSVCPRINPEVSVCPQNVEECHVVVQGIQISQTEEQHSESKKTVIETSTSFTNPVQTDRQSPIVKAFSVASTKPFTSVSFTIEQTTNMPEQQETVTTTKVKTLESESMEKKSSVETKFPHVEVLPPLSAFASAFSTLPDKPFEPQLYIHPIQPVDLPQEKSPYVPKDIPVTVEPVKKDVCPSSFVQALTTAPERPYSPIVVGFGNAQQTNMPDYLKDLPAASGQALSMVSALTTACDRPFTPVLSVDINKDILDYSKETETLQEQTQVIKQAERPKPMQSTITTPKRSDRPVAKPASHLPGTSSAFKPFKPVSQSFIPVEEAPGVPTHSFPPVSDELKSAFSKVSEFASIKSQIQEAKVFTEEIKREESIAVQQEEAAELKKVQTGAGLQKPDTLPSYQKNLQQFHPSKAPIEQPRLAPQQKPITTVQPGQMKPELTTGFQPVTEENERRQHLSLLSPLPRSVTPSLINKPAPIIPQYQLDLLPRGHLAVEANLFDPRSPAHSRSPSPIPGRISSPFPGTHSPHHGIRVKSPAPGPPTNPLIAIAPKKAPVKHNEKFIEAKENLKTYIPKHQGRIEQIKREMSELGQSQVSQRSPTRQPEKLQVSVGGGNQQSMVQTENYQNMQIAQASGLQQTASMSVRQAEQMQQTASMSVRQAEQMQHLQQINKSQSQTVETSADNTMQIQRTKRVQEEFERTQKSKVIEIERSSSGVRELKGNNGQMGLLKEAITPARPTIPSFPPTLPDIKPVQKPVAPKVTFQSQPGPSFLRDSKPSTLAKGVAPKAPTNLSGSRPNVSQPNAGAGGGRQSGAVGVAPKRGRGILNLAAGPGSRVPLCAQCNAHIRGPFITALGKIWCPDHFVCVTPSCRKPLQDLGFVEENGQLYCEFCFEQYLAPACSKCNSKIKGDCLNAIGKHFHPECFNCAYCGKLFGNSPFFLEDSLPYCETDWNELFTTKCFACGFPVEAGDRWVEALNNNYHSQCFNCTMCKKNLEGQSFFAKGGRPFCKNHAR